MTKRNGFSAATRRRRPHRPKRSPRMHRAFFETLEPRMMLTTAAMLDGNDDLVLSGDGGSNDIRLSLVASGTELRLEDPNGITASGPEFTADGPNAFRIALADITGEDVIVNAAGDADSLTIDNGGGILTLPIDYNGGTGNDSLVLTGDPGSVVARESYVVGGSQDAGTWTLDPDGTTGNGDELVVSFSGLEPDDSDAPVATFDVVLTPGIDDVSIEDGGTLGGVDATQVVDNGGTFESFRFANKATVLINGADGADAFFVDHLFPAAGLNSLELYGHDVTGTDTTDDNADDSFTVNVYGDPAGLTIDGGGGNNVIHQGDRLEDNETFAAAADLGAVPGTHINRLSLYQPGDDDWYQVELLRGDDLEFSLTFDHSVGNVDLEVYDDTQSLLGSSTSTTDDELVALTGLAAGTYYVRAFSPTSDLNVYDLSIEPAATSTTRVFYVNDADTSDGFYTLAAGDDANDGLSPTTPKASVHTLLVDYDVGPDDAIVIDTGVYNRGTVTVTADDEGATYAGTPAGSQFTSSSTRFELEDADANVFFGLHFTQGGGTGIHARSTASGDSTDNVFRSNTIDGPSTGIRIERPDDDVIADNVIRNVNTGIQLDGVGDSIIRGNEISLASTGIRATGVFNNNLSLTVEDNRVSESDFGIRLNSWTAAMVSGNELFDNGTGLFSDSVSNTIFANHIHNNETGLIGNGTFGPANWTGDLFNDVHNNDVGIQADFDAEVRFNRIHQNDVGVLADRRSDIHHNVIFRNTSRGVVIDGADTVTVTNNTIFAPTGDGLRVQNHSSNVQLRNNIIWVEDGYGVWVDTSSQPGFDSDYNNLFATRDAMHDGKIVWWQKDFLDLFDWQVEANFDNNSIGYTALDPLLDDPRFVDLAGDNYRLQDAASTSIDAGDPNDAFANEPSPDGGRINLGAYGNTSQAALSRASFLEVDHPNYYTDWPEDVGRAILWHSFNVTGTVDIDLLDAAGNKVADIAERPVGDGSFGWSPQDSGITGEVNNRYRIRLTSVDSPAVVDTSREVFSVPPTGDDFYVDDGSDTDDQYTPSATGDNRNTGKTPGDPKATLLPVLRSYDLDPQDTVHIDAGNYIHVRNVIISGEAGVGDDEGATFTGPADPAAGVATIDRANTNPGSTNIELNDGDFVTLRHLTLLGAESGVIVHNGSRNFTGEHLTVSNNTGTGIRVDSDAEMSQLDALTAFDNGDTGILIETPISRLSNSRAFNNRTGISVRNSDSGAPATIIGSVDDMGNPSLAPNEAGAGTGHQGNEVFNNSSIGIRATGNVLVFGISVYGHNSSNARGIELHSQATAEQNVIHSNFNGITTSLSGDLIRNNRVFNQANTGIVTTRGDQVEGNVVYSNTIGVNARGNFFFGDVFNNTIYDNATHGILVESGSSTPSNIFNNTVFQPLGDAVRIQSNADNIRLSNNILWAQSGFDISVSPDSQTGFASDFNVLMTSGGGQVAQWQGVARPTLVAWQNTAFTDANSIAQDPLFVDPDGADDVLGFGGAGASDGRDDDFHLSSTEGRVTGGLVPVLDTTTGLPVGQASAEMTDAVQSPAIDRGDANDPFANEPSPNGGFINIGAYGNTVQASKSPAQYILTTKPDGGEIWPADQTFPIRWRSHDTAGTVDVELIRDGDAGFNMLIADDTPNDGEFSWMIPAGITPQTDYRVQISRNDLAATDASNNPFEITAPITQYYVNIEGDTDFSDNQYTTAAGSDANSGLSPSMPKATISSVLQNFDLGPGDVILVDTGQYVLATNIGIDADDSGVIVRGPTDADKEAILDRGNTSSGSYVFELNGADDVTIEHLSITGANTGVFAAFGAGSDNLVVADSRIFDHSSRGVWINGGNESTRIENSDVFDNSTGIEVEGNLANVVGNRVYLNSTGIAAEPRNFGDPITVIGNTVHDNSSRGIRISDPGTVAEGNLVYGHEDSSTGISLDRQATARDNVIYGVRTGISTSLSGDHIIGNRVFNTTEFGITVRRSDQVIGNVVYNNPIGIRAQDNFRGLISNNIAYNNTTNAIQLENSSFFSNLRVINNTVFQPVGDGVRVQSNTVDALLKNNILLVENGHAISVADDSQAGFESDYNLFQFPTGVPGEGLGFWAGRDFDSRVDWFYELGFDQHSRVADPLFVDRGGADDLLGFSTTPVGAAQIIDDEDAGFSLTGPDWTEVAGSGGFNDDWYEAPGFDGDNVAAWTFDSLATGWYEVAATWRSGLGTDFSYATNARFNVFDDDRHAARSRQISQREPSDDFTDAGVDWERLATVFIDSGTLTVTLADDANNDVIADAVRIQQIEGDGGADDRDGFRLTPASPAIDAGDPIGYYLAEPLPNGGRTNLGAFGNTPDAATSPAELVQVLSPNGFEKFQVGQTVEVQWRSAGLTENHTMALINAGADEDEVVENWLEDVFKTDGSTSLLNSPIDVSMVTDPAPEAVYQRYARATSGVGERLAYPLPLPDGDYSLRLHFMEPDSFPQIGDRVFDVRIDGGMVLDDFDVFADAGANHKAVTQTIGGVTVAGGNGLVLELVNETSDPAVLSAIEITTDNPSGSPDPRADVEVSTDNGSNFTQLATNQPMDRFGRGTFDWTIAPGLETNDNTALIRVTVNPDDTSDEPFLIAGSGNDYYVNDDSLADDVFTVATGDNANSGKSIDRPMASLFALLSAYELGTGDMVHVDTGDYDLIRNIVIDSSVSGVRIEGPDTSVALLDRGNTATGSYVFELIDADDVTIADLSMTGANIGIFAELDADSDGATITGNRIFRNSVDGVRLERDNDDALIEDNEVFRQGTTGIRVESDNPVVRRNRVYDNQNTGIIVDPNTSDAPALVTENIVFGNRSIGISIRERGTVALNNEVYGHTGTNAFGIFVDNQARAEGNIVHINVDGIRSAVNSNGATVDNRVFNNINIGIHTLGRETVRGNQVYANSIGIEASRVFRGLVANNVIYNNSNQGILARDARDGSRFINNTVVQPVGDAVRIEQSSDDVTLHSNILMTQAGHAISVADDSQLRLDSDYNLLQFPTGTPNMGLANWQDVDFDVLGDWVLEIGLDRSSLVTDPRFIDPGGADDLLGFSQAPVGPPQIIDNGDAEHSTIGDWTTNTSAGHLGDQDESPAGNGDDVATWTFSGLTPGAYYQVAATWSPRNDLAFDAPYSIFDGGDAVGSVRVNQTAAPDDFQDAGTDWDSLGVFRVSGPTLEVRLSDDLNSQFDIAAADAIRIVQVAGDGGEDDRHGYRLQNDSPAIDRGDPLVHFLQEPVPNGERINIGAFGNTPQAATSPAQRVQVVSPVGFEKFEVGQQVPVQWRSSGLTEQRVVGLINAGDDEVIDNWLIDEFRQNGSMSSTNESIDTSMVANAAPEGVYQSYARSEFGVGESLDYAVPVPDGDYAVRLHFVDPDHFSPFVGERVFDVFVQGQLVLDDYDIFAATGADGPLEAIAESFNNVTVSGGGGLTIELVSVTSNEAVLSGIEILADNPAGEPDPRADVDVSIDNGGTFTSLATDLAMDRFGRGTFDWTIAAGTETAGHSGLIRVNVNPQDTSPHPFSIAGDGTDYYINDDSLTGDTVTTAVGDNLASGKSPDAPMADLFALINNYDLDAGDVIHVDTGDYAVIRTIEIGPQDGGVRIEALDPTASVFDRGNTFFEIGHVIDIELNENDDVTIDGLGVTGGNRGITASCISGVAGRSGCSMPANVTISNSEVFNHTNIGIFAEQFVAAVIETNIVRNNATGIQVESNGTTVRNNNVFDNSLTGISSDQFSGQITVIDNTVHDNGNRGIHGQGAASLIRRNTVFGHSSNGRGILLENGAEARENEVFDNTVGIQSISTFVTETIVDNRVFNNAETGIDGSGEDVIDRNFIYSNSTGIEIDNDFQITNNLIYANSNQGIFIRGANRSGDDLPSIVNNTVFQQVGDAVRIESSSRDVFLRNNILWVDAGRGLFVADNSQTDLDSDRNLFTRGPDPMNPNPAASVGFFDGADRTTLADWQSASGQDATSIQGDPGFLDVNGADNVLGFTTAGGGFDGGRDDNFFVIAGSPAIDRGDTFAAPPNDITGSPRFDDPNTPNSGTNDYSETDAGAGAMPEVGVAQGWRRDNSSWGLNLPFEFPFYATTFDNVTVSSEGMLHFDGPGSARDETNSTSELRANARIAPLWMNLRTNGADDDIFIDQSVAGQITIRWDATVESDDSDVDFLVTLHDTGMIEVNYGFGPASLPATIGISRGDENFALLSALNGSSINDNIISFDRDVAGFADVGAFEFRGDSGDATPPTVTGTAPAEVHSQSPTNAALDSIQISFSEALNQIDANAPANYELRDDGGDGVFDNGNDAVLPLTPDYIAGGLNVTLAVDAGVLPDGNYRLTVSGNTSIHDLAGNRLDGDNDSNEGGDYVRTFTVDRTPPAVTVDALQTSDPTPELTGTVDDPAATIQITVGGNIYSATNNGNGTWTLADNTIDPPLADGTYDVVATATDTLGNSDTDSMTDELQIVAPQVVGRHLFYNNSFWDEVGQGRDDDDAIATDKLPLLPGETALRDNYSSYRQGINGILIDAADFTDAEALTPADFEFRVGNNNTPASWSPAPVPAVDVRPGEGVGGSDRIVLVWPDAAIRNVWLQVTVLANENTGLSAADVFYFGNAAGESGDSTTHTLVNAFDFAGPRDNAANGAGIENRFDYNRDGNIDGTDMAIARDNVTNIFTSLQLITPPIPAPPQVMLIVAEELAREETEKKEEPTLVHPLSRVSSREMKFNTLRPSDVRQVFETSKWPSSPNIDSIVSDDLLQLLAEEMT